MAKKKKEEIIERACAFCEFGTPIPNTARECADVICPKKGIVSEDSVCRKFRYDPLKRNPKEKRPLPEMEVISLDD